MYNNLYQFGFDRAKELAEKFTGEYVKSIDGLSGEEEALAIATIEAEEEDDQEEDDQEDEAYEIYDDNGGYNN